MPFKSRATRLGGALKSAGSAAYTNYKGQKLQVTDDRHVDVVEGQQDGKKPLGQQSELYEILACMIQGVYAADRGREDASLFWETFGYEEESLQAEQMTEEEIAAVGNPTCKVRLKVFRQRDLAPRVGNEQKPLPKYVIAIRGTRKFCQRDILADLQILSETLHHNPLYDIVKNMTRKVVMKHSHDTVCLAGHSLGAAIGLIVTRELALEGMAMETHLFNPPFFSLETLVEKFTKVGAKGLERLSRVFKAGSEGLPYSLQSNRITNFVKARKTMRDPEYLKAMAMEFTKLEKWTPSLYVNQHDLICNAYIDYFRNQNLFNGGPDTLAITLTAGSLRKFTSLDSHSYHLIPSANLYINHRGDNVLKSHPLEQWHDYPTENLVQEKHDLLAELAASNKDLLVEEMAICE
ncbi:hypothetical protein M758_4G037600 [Ceratodon purpureus]|uniref:Fungal lipase-like domain-containing protein n=1 Tax=Ceratodon purpureus TaxID=3225 RepID=A0A8T0I507_CERPU|nr:hypothetical protein KC19_4G040900 [Ceratodon purpureus]KAG0618084.1 hypothetical protein M758_4G037600 [Ceratodon purpureus]